MTGARSSDAVRDILIAITGGRLDRRTVTTDALIIDLIDNRDGPGEGFVFWPWYLEIDGAPDVDMTQVIAAIRRLLAALTDAGVQAVPSCDFEDQLRTEPCP